MHVLTPRRIGKDIFLLGCLRASDTEIQQSQWELADRPPKPVPAQNKRIMLSRRIENYLLGKGSDLPMFLTRWIFQYR